MSEQNITGGTLSYEDAVKKDTGGDPQYWPTKRAKAELRFDVLDGEDGQAVIDRISNVARAKVAEMLGLAVAGLAAGAVAGVVGVGGDATSTPAAAPRGRGRPSAAQKAAEAAAGPQSSASAAQDAASPAPATPAAEVSAETAPGGEVSATPGETTSTASDDWATDAATAEIPDTELNSACSATAERIKDPVPVRELIQTFNSKPAGEKFKITELPQSQRADFLAKLKALQPKA